MTSAGAAEACSVILYAIPLGAFLAVRCTRATRLASLALDIPLFVAVDLVGILLLTLVVPLEVAILLSRPLWLVGCAASARRQLRTGRRGIHLPTAVGIEALTAALLSAVAAAYLSASISRNYLIWDRYWHAPQISAIATQTLPFVNVFSPKVLWRYHYAADILAEVFRTLSFDVMSSNRALSVVHDAVFALIAATLALLMRGLGQRAVLIAALGGLLVLLHGPIPLHGSLSGPMYGVMYSNFLVNSFRFNVVLGGLFMVGFIGTVAARLLDPAALPREEVLARLVAMAAAMSLTDETSLAVLDAALGLAWLAFPGLLGFGRTRGIVALVAVAAASVSPSVLLGGSFARGSPVQKLTWGDAQVPSADRRGIFAFPGEAATKALVFDLLPFVLGCIGIALIVARRPSRPLLSLLLFAVAVPLACALLGTHIRVNGQSVAEVQRFFVVPFFAVVVVGLLLLPQAPPGSAGSLFVLGSIVVPAVFSLYWRIAIVPQILNRESTHADDFLDIDCRHAAGARLGDRAQPMYVESSVYALYTSCRAVFSPGGVDPPWPINVFPHFVSSEQLPELDAAMLGRDQTSPAVCRADSGGPSDPVCARLLQHPSACTPDGTRFVRCPLTPADRAALLGRAASAPE
ncbi:MAG: hypothetical protein M3O50_10860 [Myxococcota bacterium]|nr:hypothetical protein [Myxococcota bacterium]